METVPSQVLYSNMKLPSVSGSSQTVSFSASNGSEFNSQSNNEIRIPISAAGFLDSSQGTLQFQIKNNGAANGDDATLAHGAGCLFKQLRIECGSVEVERIDDMNVLHKIINTYSGIRNENLTISEGGVVSQANGTTVSGVEIKKDETHNCALRLHSGLLQNSGKKAIPLLGTQGLTLILTLENVTAALVAATGKTVASYSVINPRYVASVFQVSDPRFAERYMSMVQDTGIEIHGVSYKRYTGSLNAGAGPKTVQLNDRSLSLRGFIGTLRTTADLTTAVRDSISSRLIGVTRYIYSVSGQNCPTQGVNYLASNPSEAFAEAEKVFGTASSSTGSNVDLTDFTAVGVDFRANGILCVDLKKWGDHSTSFNGLNTAASTMPSTLEITTAAAGVASTAVIFAQVDAMYRLDSSGIFSVAM